MYRVNGSRTDGGRLGRTVGDKAGDSWEICGLDFYENMATHGKCFNLVNVLKSGVGGLHCCRSKQLLKAISIYVISYSF